MNYKVFLFDCSDVTKSDALLKWRMVFKEVDVKDEFEDCGIFEVRLEVFVHIGNSCRTH